jgi:hypothetical protein
VGIFTGGFHAVGRPRFRAPAARTPASEGSLRDRPRPPPRPRRADRGRCGRPASSSCGGPATRGSNATTILQPLPAVKTRPVGTPRGPGHRGDDPAVVHEANAAAAPVRREQLVLPHRPQHALAAGAGIRPDPQAGPCFAITLASEPRGRPVSADRRQRVRIGDAWSSGRVRRHTVPPGRPVPGSSGGGSRPRNALPATGPAPRRIASREFTWSSSWPAPPRTPFAPVPARRWNRPRAPFAAPSPRD